MMQLDDNQIRADIFEALSYITKNEQFIEMVFDVSYPFKPQRLRSLPG